MDPVVYVWVGIAVLAVIAEVSTAALVSVWFIPAALIAAGMALLGLPLWSQILVFLAVSFVCLWLGRMLVHKRRRDNPPEATNAEALIGQRCVVTEAINNLEGRGQVQIRGQFWSARTADDDVTVPADTVVTVEGIEGVKLICR